MSLQKKPLLDNDDDGDIDAHDNDGDACGDDGDHGEEYTLHNDDDDDWRRVHGASGRNEPICPKPPPPLLMRQEQSRFISKRFFS